MSTKLSKQQPKEIRWSFFLWVVFFLVIIILGLLGHHHRTVTPNYIYAAWNWLNEQSLYNHTGQGFIYLPQAAIFYIPFALINFGLSEILWRFFSLGFYCCSFYQLASLQKWLPNSRLFWIFTLVSIPLAFDSARNGQFNIILAALMMFACVALARCYFWWSAFCLALGFVLKPTMIVQLLLFWALYKPLWWRLPLILVGLFLLPFLTQEYTYVLTQYQEAYHMLFEAMHIGDASLQWAQFFGLLAQVGLGTVPATIQTIIRLLMALMTFLLCFRIQKQQHILKVDRLFFIYAISVIYLMLFNPRTENNDYILMAPALAFGVAYTVAENKYLQKVFLILIVMGMVGSYSLSQLFFHPYKSVFAPLMTLCFAIWFMVFIFKK